MKKYIIFLGKSDSRIEQWARAHAPLVVDENLTVLFIAPYGRDSQEGNFRFVNCMQFTPRLPIWEIQAAMSTSINRALACDRSLTDYTWHVDSYKVSKKDRREVDDIVAAMATALKHFLPETEYCVDGLFDNFVTPLGFFLARDYGVPFYLIRRWQYWHRHFMVVDLPGYRSSLLEKRFPHHLCSMTDSEAEVTIQKFNDERYPPLAFSGEGIRLLWKIRGDKWQTYERPSIRNSVRRKIRRLYGQIAAKALPRVSEEELPGKYILFALHVAPEASILGTNPEYADQFSLIRAMSINIPYGVEILIKPHPGDRYGRDLDIKFLRELGTLHNVHLLRETERIGGFLSDKRCVAVATINGSVAFDSALVGKPVFTFGVGLHSPARDCFLQPEDWRDFYQTVLKLTRGEVTVCRRSLAALIRSMEDALIDTTISQKEPSTWLDLYRALLPGVHRYHLEACSQK